MRYQRIDLNLLVALDVLLAERNVTRAAEKLHMTQPAMSGVLAKLRDYFVDPLLAPVGRGMRLTPFAETLVAPVREIILRVDTVVASRSEFDAASAQRQFVIIASDYVSRVFLSEVLRHLSTSAPGLTFDIQPTRATMAQELEQGEVDFLITPAHLAVSSQPQVELFEDTYKVIACAANPHVAAPFGLEQYTSLGHVVYQDERGANPWFEQWFANQYGRSRRVEVIAHSFSLMPSFIIGTSRVATVQTRLAQQFVQTLPMQLVAPPMATPRLSEVLQWHRYRDNDPGCTWLRHQLLRVAALLDPI